VIFTTKPRRRITDLDSHLSGSPRAAESADSRRPTKAAFDRGRERFLQKPWAEHANFLQSHEVGRAVQTFRSGWRLRLLEFPRRWRLTAKWVSVDLGRSRGGHRRERFSGPRSVAARQTLIRKRLGGLRSGSRDGNALYVEGGAPGENSQTAWAVYRRICASGSDGLPTTESADVGSRHDA